MSFLLRNKTTTAVEIQDLGITVEVGTDYELLDESPADVQASAQPGGDLNTLLTSGDLVVVDPRDSSVELSPAQGILVAQLHNNPNWGIYGGTLTQLDDVNLGAGPNPSDLLQFDNSGILVPASPSLIAGNIRFGDLLDIVDNTSHGLGSFFILEGDGTNLVAVDGATDTTVFIPFIEDTAGNVVSGGTQTDLTLTYNTTTNRIDASVNDVFLRNTGDTLDSGTLNVAPGASIVISSGATISWPDSPTAGNHLANKAYVDSVASGLDAKDACDIATRPGVVLPNYNPTGGSAGTGAFTGVDLTSIDPSVVPEKVPPTPYVGERVLVKNQTDPKQNGIYEVVSVGGSPLGSVSDLQRSSDFDGNPSNEISSGAFTFVLYGDTNAKTGWIAKGSGVLTPNVDPIEWTQISSATSYTAGAGLGLNGTQFYLDVNNLTTINVVGTDEIAVNDVTDNTTKKISFNTAISDLGIYTSSNLSASDGVSLVSGVIQLDITGLTAATPSLLSEIVFDPNVTGSHNKATLNSVVDTLDIPYGITANGFVTRTANDTYTSRTLQVDATAGNEGISITNADGVAGDPTIGFNISGLTASTINLSSTDQLVIYNGTNNLRMSGQQLADGISQIIGALGNAYTTIQGNSGTASAATSTDTLAIVGGTNSGIRTTAADGAPDTVNIFLDINSLVTTTNTLTLTDLIAFTDGSTTNNKVSFSKIFGDLGVPNSIAGTGIVTSISSGSYTTRTIVDDATGPNDGIVVTNGDGVAGNPTVGLSITGLTPANKDMEASDVFAVNNATSGNNEKITGQEIANGAKSLMGFGNLNVAIIGGQEVLTLVDTTRGNKVLSIETSALTWSENRVSNNDWLQIGNANDSRTGYIVPWNATIVKVTAHTANNRGNVKPILLYVNGVNVGSIATFNGPSGEDSFINDAENIDLVAGDKIRLRGGTGGRIEDVVVTLWIKWRV